MSFGRLLSLAKRRISLIGLLAFGWTPTSSANCLDAVPSLQASSVRASSEWREFNAQGEELVLETGTLTGPEITAAYRCDRWHLGARIAELDGQRIYDGQTTSGRPVQSQAAIKQRQADVHAMFAFSDSWRLGGRMSKQIVWRDIAPASGALGYPERFDWTMLSAGMQWQSTLGPGQLSFTSWAGKQLSSSLLITLPGRDQATLKLGAVKQLEFVASWRTRLISAWYFQAEIGYRRLEMTQGDTSIIRRGGVPVGVAYQPKSVMTERPIAIQIGYEF